MKRLVVSLPTLFLLAYLEAPRAGETPESWYRAGELQVEQAVALGPIRGTARNVILFLGDGMGITTVTAARILAGQMAGAAAKKTCWNSSSSPTSRCSRLTP